MASATATLTVNPYPAGTDNTQSRVLVYGTCALSSGGDYVTGGIPVSFSTMLDGNFNGAKYFIVPNIGPWNGAPASCFFWSATGATGYSYIFDQTSSTLRIYNGGTELTNSTVPTTDTINFCAEFLRNL